MKTFNVGLLFALIVVGIGNVTSIAVNRAPLQEEPEVPKPIPNYPRWEYKNVPRNFDEEFSERTLNKHGKEGWELVIIYEDQETAVFKRPLELQMPRIEQ